MYQSAQATLQAAIKRLNDLEAADLTQGFGSGVLLTGEATSGTSDPTHRIIAQFAVPVSQPPNLDLLRDFLTTKPQGLAFPLSSESYEAVEPYDLSGMFSRGTSSRYCKSLEKLFFYAVFSPPDVGVTKFSFIPFWNLIIHQPLKMYLQVTTAFSFDRNTTQTVAQLPDYIGYVGSLYSLFRGEEESPRGSGDPRQELVDKLVWVYKSLPYLLGYYARGKNVTFVALYPEEGKVQFRDLATVNLDGFAGRLKCQLILFNVSRVLAGLCELCTACNEISDTYRVQLADPERGGKSVTLCGRTVIKGFLELEQAKKVWEVYSWIKDCPNAEKCRTQKMPSKRKRDSGDDGYCLKFTPRVSSTHRARSIEELLRALLHVSNALCYAHAHHLMHRDVSWRNVGLDVDTDQWILLDWDETCRSPSRTATTLSGQCHAPEMSRGRHDTAVDVWGLGWLIQTSKVEPSAELEQLRLKCMDPKPGCRPTMSWCKEQLTEILSSITSISPNV